jgi:hypothetical protein
MYKTTASLLLGAFLEANTGPTESMWLFPTLRGGLRAVVDSNNVGLTLTLGIGCFNKKNRLPRG